MPALRRICTRPIVPRAAVRAQPLQHLKVAALCRASAKKLLVPHAAAVGAQPLHHLEMSALRRLRARIFVPQAVVSTRPLYHLEVPALRRPGARVCVPRAAVLAQRLQLFEISSPRRYRTKVLSTRQATSPLQALHRAYTSKVHGFMLGKLLKLQSRRRHRVAHRAAHCWEPCEICGVVEILRFEDVRGDEVVGKAGDGLARGSIAFARWLLRASFQTKRRVERHR